MKKLEQRVPNLRFKGFTDDWEQRKLGTLFQKNIERNDDEKFNYNQTLSVSTMTFKPNGNGASAKSLANYKVLRLGDVAFEGHPNKQFSYGRFVVNDNADGIMSPRFATIRPIKAININYWKNYLHNENVMKYVLVKSTKAGTMMNELVYSDLYKQVLKVPNITEQVKIGNLLQKIEIIITLQQRKLDLLKQLKKGLLQKMFADKDSKRPVLRFKGFHDDWEQRKLYEVADYRNGKAHEQHIYIHGNYIVVNSKFVSTSGKAKKYSDKLIEPLMKNEIAFVLSDVPNGKALARTFLVKRSQKYTLNQRVAGITPHPNMNSYFLFILMNRNPYFLKFDDGVGQTNLSKKDVEQFNENYPTKREQQKIGEIFVKLDSLLTLQQQKLIKYQSIKKSLLQQMLI